jgi:membrane protease YdiL (CAAX protease family)
MTPDLPINNDKRWGRWTRFGLGLLSALVAQIPALVAYSWLCRLDFGRWSDLAHEGIVVVVLVCVSTPIQVALLALLARLVGGSATEYLGLIIPTRRTVAAVLVAVLIFFAISDGISWLSGRDIVTQFEIEIYSSASAAGWLPWLWLTTTVVAPIGEETLFRGFLFRSLLRSPGDARTAIAVTALLWAIIHVQYDFFVIGQIFGFGLAFGWARWKTGSTLPTILLHGILNAAGMFETHMAVRG